MRTACLMKRRRRSGEPRHIVSLDSVLPGDGNAGALDVAQYGHSPETLAANSALRRRLTKALHELPPSYRVIVFLREMEGLTTKEAAVVLRTSESNVKMRLHRARLFLRKQLEER